MEEIKASGKKVYRCDNCGIFWTHDKSELSDDGFCVDCEQLREFYDLLREAYDAAPSDTQKEE